MKNVIQKIGTVVLVASLVALFLEEFTLCWILLGVLLALDLWSIYKDEETVTQWYKPLFPKKTDIILTIGIPLIFIVFQSPLVGLYFVMGAIHGHLNWDW